MKRALAWIIWFILLARVVLADPLIISPKPTGYLAVLIFDFVVDFGILLILLRLMTSIDLKANISRIIIIAVVGMFTGLIVGFLSLLLTWPIDIELTYGLRSLMKYPLEFSIFLITNLVGLTLIYKLLLKFLLRTSGLTSWELSLFLGILLNPAIWSLTNIPQFLLWWF